MAGRSDAYARGRPSRPQATLFKGDKADASTRNPPAQWLPLLGATILLGGYRAMFDRSQLYVSAALLGLIEIVAIVIRTVGH
jgi:hypothetical protein